MRRGRPHWGPDEATARTRYRLDLSAQNRTSKPLFPGCSAALVRRIRGGNAAEDYGASGASGYLPFPTLRTPVLTGAELLMNARLPSPIGNTYEAFKAGHQP